MAAASNSTPRPLLLGSKLCLQVLCGQRACSHPGWLCHTQSLQQSPPTCPSSSQASWHSHRQLLQQHPLCRHQQQPQATAVCSLQHPPAAAAAHGVWGFGALGRMRAWAVLGCRASSPVMGYQLQACKSTRHMLRSLCRPYHVPMVQWWSRTLQLASDQHCLLDTAVALRLVSGCYVWGCNMFGADNLQD